MRPVAAFLCFSSLSISCHAGGVDLAKLKDGDIVFQTSRSSQSKAIQAATHSPYSHMGILFRNGHQWMVLEAVQPVKWTPVDRWAARGAGGHLVLKRLKNRESRLTAPILARMKQVGLRFLGKPYDLTFEWSDDRIYCSELVWKIYQEGAAIEVGSLQRLKDFDLTHPAVRAKLHERYRDRPPMDEPVISPQRMFDSPEFETILQR